MTSSAKQSAESLPSSVVSPEGWKIPKGNDPAAWHSDAHKTAETLKWRKASFLFAIPVFTYAAFIILKELTHHEEHAEETPAYEYIRVSWKSPRFPWGDRDLIGTPADREKWREEDGTAKAAH
eukprot:CAMPEP_0184691330 /NCGR_PEP_ID=MMETSP0313-20130426/220_1 /TAXON_ID=2792 /ORGANISM="Porphyridium aerugineum, Strain SAG 1380-2" /LENGTH=122 /DNA_ID=CAMNT_0027149023 /DNA_START=159 /DNA_END=527 /DNA_ORIENTATION=+